MTGMDIKHLEPFAWGYMHAEKSDPESRIAEGIYTFAAEAEITIDPADWFCAPLAGGMGSFAVNYARADGVTLNHRRRDENIAWYPDAEETINVYYDYFIPYETAHIIGKDRTPLQEKLEINKCCWAAGGGHSNPDYEMLLRIGTDGIRRKMRLFRGIHTDKTDLYDAFERTLDAFELLCRRYGEKAREMLPAAGARI